MLQNYISNVEPEFKDVIWYYPWDDGTFECRIYGIHGWQTVVNVKYNIIDALNQEISRAKNAEEAITILVKANTDLINGNTTLIESETSRATGAESQIRQELEDVSQRLSSKIILIEQEDYDALTSYEKDTIYLIYTPKEYVLVEKPIDRTFTYDGTSHALVSTNAYTVIGTGSSQVGTYHFNVTLNYDPVTNTAYKWADGTTDDIVVTYIIEPVVVDTTWHFGDQFPIRFSDDSIWHFGDKFPIVFS